MIADANLLPDPAELKMLEIEARDRDADGYFDFCRRSLGEYGDQSQVQLVLHYAKLRPSYRLLDVGCGVGRTLIQAAPRVSSAVGVDFSGRSIEILRKELKTRGITNVDARVEDVTTARFEDSAFDVVVAQSVIQHIPTPELRVETLHSLRRTLKPGGQLVAMVYRWGGKVRLPKPKEGKHLSQIYYYAFTPQEIRQLLLDAGFERVRLRGFLWLPHFIWRRLSARQSWLEPLLAKAPWSTNYGYHILATGRRSLGDLQKSRTAHN